MASFTTPTPPLRADWTASGACTSGLTAPPGDATKPKPVSGGAATTSTSRLLRTPARVATQRGHTLELSQLLADSDAGPRQRSSAPIAVCRGREIAGWMVPTATL